MREAADAERIKRFMQALGAAAPEEGTCYLVGGGTAVLLGWRESTIDVDIELDPEQDEAAPSPTRRSRTSCGSTSSSPRRATSSRFPAGWEERKAPPPAAKGRLTFKHSDLLLPGARQGRSAGHCAGRRRRRGPCSTAGSSKPSRSWPRSTRSSPSSLGSRRSTPAISGSGSKTSSRNSRAAADPFLAALVELLLPERDALLQPRRSRPRQAASASWRCGAETAIATDDLADLAAAGAVR